MISWSIAFIEYGLTIPANRLSFGKYSGFQLKLIQEAVTLTVFIVTFLKEWLTWNYLVAPFF